MNLRTLFRFGILMLILGSGPFSGRTQEAPPPQSQDLVLVKMKDGSQFVGRRLAVSDRQLVIESASIGTLNLDLENIAQIKEVSKGDIIRGEYWFPNPGANRNILGPTAYGLERGEGYYQNFMLLLNQLNYGVSENFSIGLIFEITSLLVAIDEGESFGPGFALTPKFTVPIAPDKYHIGVGGLIAELPGTDRFLDLGIIYGISTFGTRDKNFSFGLGFGYADGDFSAQPTITISGNLRTSREFSLVTENWFVEGLDGAIFSVGARVFRERMSWEAALFGLVESGDFIVVPVPIIGVVIPFGRKAK